MLVSKMLRIKDLLTLFNFYGYGKESKRQQGAGNFGMH